MKTTYVYREGQVVEKPAPAVIEPLDFDPSITSAVVDFMDAINAQVATAYSPNRERAAHEVGRKSDAKSEIAP